MTNLPPGVSASDIPGNHPEDVFYDRLSDELADFLGRYGIDFAEMSDDSMEVYAEILWSVFGFIGAHLPEMEG